MAEVKNAFIKSKMNKDLDARLIPNGEYRDANNIQVSKSQGEDVGALENIFGNAVAVNGDFGADAGSDNLTCIGYVVDDSSNLIYLFFTDYTDSYSSGVSTYNESAKNFIYSYNVSSGQKNKLVQGSFLNFSTNRPIIGVNILENLLFWTDNRNQPRKINTTLANPSELTDPVYYVNEDQISVAKYNPYQSIELFKPSETAGVTTVTTNATATVTDSKTFSVADATGISSGLGVTGLEIATNTYVTAVNGLDITVNKPQTISSTSENINFVGLETTMYDNFSELLPSLGTSHVNDAAVVNTDTFDIDKVQGFISTGDVVTGGGIVAGTTVVSFTPGAANDEGELVVSQNQTLLDDNQLFFHKENPYYKQDFSGDPQYLEDKFIRFSYRFRFVDGEYSILAPFTQEAFIPKQDGYFIFGDEQQTPVSTIVGFMENKVNKIDLQIPLPSAVDDLSSSYLITDIDIIYKESDSTAVRVIETIPVSQIQGNENVLNYTYLSQKPYKTLPSDEIIRVYDKIPVKALSQEVSSNRVIYGNFQDKHTPPNFIDYQVAASTKAQVSSVGSSLTTVEYPNHNLKENRNYQVGVVLSDKFGRQSTVILSNNVGEASAGGFGADTVYLPYNPNNNSIDFSGNSIKMLFNSILSGVGIDRNETTGTPGLYNSDVTSLDYNPLGWYSYKIVVKQTEQDYYNVYTAGAMKGLPYYNTGSIPLRDENATFITLLNDNINKIPRDLSEVGAQDKQFRSSVQLFGRVENTASEFNTVGSKQYFPERKSFTVNQIEDLFDSFDVLQFYGQGGTDIIPVTDPNSPYYAFFRSESNPFVAEFVTSNVVEDQFGLINLPYAPNQTYQRFENINIFETKPTESRLDIYWETSTSGLISDLNIAIASQGSPQAAQIVDWQYNHSEANGPGDDITTNFKFIDILGNDIASFDSIVMTVTDDALEDVTSKFTLIDNLDGTFKVQVAVGEYFLYKTNTPANIFDYKFVTVVNPGDAQNTVSMFNQPLINITPTITNVIPNNEIEVFGFGGSIVIQTITGINGSNASGNRQGDNLTYSIEWSRGVGVFEIQNGTTVVNTNPFTGTTPGFDSSFSLVVSDNGSPINLVSRRKFFVKFTPIP